MTRKKKVTTRTPERRLARIAAFLSPKAETGAGRPGDPRSTPSGGPSTSRPRVISQVSSASQISEYLKKTKGARPRVISQVSSASQISEYLKKTKGARPLTAMTRGIGGKLISRLNDSRRRFIIRNRPNAHQHGNQTKPVINPSLGFRPATFTGFRELPVGKAFVMLLLWFPRFFIPWITAWHEFNVYLMSSSWVLEHRQGELLRNKIYVFAGKSIITILCSMIVDLFRRKWVLDLYVHQILLILFTLCPLAGGFVDATLRSGFRDEQLHKDRWVSAISLMQWAMSVGFIMFPVQLSCIYTQHMNMSRNAHYNWTSSFVLLEFINAYIAFLVITGPCPNPEWEQIASWAGLLLLMATITMLTLISMFNILAFDIFHEISYYMKAVLDVLRAMFCDDGKAEIAATPSKQRLFVDAPSGIQMKKLVWFSITILPVIWSNFSLFVVKSFLPSEYWNDHAFGSALSVFLFWKIMGVLLMVLVMFGIRNGVISTMRNPFNRKPEMIYLGLPLCLCILALITVVGRFATLSQSKEGDIIVGPIPDQDKAVMVFVNTMFKNWSICMSSTFFPPVKIRPHQLVTREVYDITEGNFTITVEVDPCFEPAIRTSILVKNIKKGEWKIFKIQLRDTNRFTKLDSWDYYRTLVWYEMLDVGDIRPKVGTPQLLIFQWEVLKWSKSSYYEMNHSCSGISRKVQVTTTFGDPSRFVRGNSYVASRNKLLWNVPAVGTWTVRLWCYLFLRSPYYYAGGSNCSPCASPLKFDVENNSLYLLTEYPYAEKTKEGRRYYPRFSLPGDPYLFETPTSPGSFMLSKLAEVAGPNSSRLPNREELQKDWAIRVSLAFAGMAAGGIFLGFIYLFWVDPPIPRYRTTWLAVCWVLMELASEIPSIRTIDVGIKSSLALLCLQIIMTGIHFVGAYFMSNPRFNFRTRRD